MIYISSDCVKRTNATIADIVEEYARNGISHIELSGGTKYSDTIIKDLIKLKKEYQLEYTCHGYFPPPREDFVINLASCDDKIYEESTTFYQNTVELMAEVGIHHLSIHAGFFTQVTKEEIGGSIQGVMIYPKLEAEQRFWTAYSQLSKLTKQKHISLYLENNVLSKQNYENFNRNNYFMMTNAQEITQNYKQYAFQLLLDIGHLNVSANVLGYDILEELMQVLPITKWLHISANDGVSDMHCIMNRENRLYEFLYQYGLDQSIPITIEGHGEVQALIENRDILQQLYRG
ncbi:MAG: TIM barrel protein [Eubacteriales bacterium]